VGAGAGIWAAWVLGTAGGIVFGNAIGDPARLGLDAAFPALFLALLAPQVRDRPDVVLRGLRLRGRRPLQAALLGAAIALALTPFTPAGVPIVAAGAACLLGLRRPAVTEPPG
jgi:predicted branched-subunit amino acid permease